MRVPVGTSANYTPRLENTSTLDTVANIPGTQVSTHTLVR